jgi:ribosome-binding factor A
MRTERIASLLTREISCIVSQEVKDPRLGMVTITRTIVSADLKNATVYFTTLGDGKHDLEILHGAKGFIRTTLARRVRMKFIPDLAFQFDDSFQNGDRIDRLFDEIKKSGPEKQ